MYAGYKTSASDDPNSCPTKSTFWFRSGELSHSQGAPCAQNLQNTSQNLHKKNRTPERIWFSQEFYQTGFTSIRPRGGLGATRSKFGGTGFSGMQFVLSKNSNRHSILSTAYYIISSNFTTKRLNSHRIRVTCRLGRKRTRS